MRQGVRVYAGFIVFVISACIGESPRWARTTNMTSTSFCSCRSYAVKPVALRSLCSPIIGSSQLCSQFQIH